MAVDGTRTSKGAPQFVGVGAPATAADLNSTNQWASDNIDGSVPTFGDLNTAGPFWPGKRRLVEADGIVYSWRNITLGWRPWESDWITYSATLTNLAVGTTGSAITEYRYEAGMVRVSFAFTLGGTGFSVGTIPTMSLPVSAATFRAPNEYRNTIPVTLFDANGGTSEGRVSAIAGSTTAVRLLNMPTGVASPITATQPFTWAAGDQMVGEFTYRVA